MKTPTTKPKFMTDEETSAKLAANYIDILEVEAVGNGLAQKHIAQAKFDLLDNFPIDALVACARAANYIDKNSADRVMTRLVLAGITSLTDRPLPDYLARLATS